MSEPPAEGKEPTLREMDILKVLWESGACSVREVHRNLIQREPDLAYNTIQTMLRIMEGKGLVDHVEEGRSFVYTARFSREDSARRFLDRVFDGVASQLMTSLLRDEKVGADELDRLQSLIDEARGRQRPRRKGSNP